MRLLKLLNLDFPWNAGPHFEVDTAALMLFGAVSGHFVGSTRAVCTAVVSGRAIAIIDIDKENALDSIVR